MGHENDREAENSDTNGNTTFEYSHSGNSQRGAGIIDIYGNIEKLVLSGCERYSVAIVSWTLNFDYYWLVVSRFRK